MLTTWTDTSNKHDRLVRRFSIRPRTPIVAHANTTLVILKVITGRSERTDPKELVSNLLYRSAGEQKYAREGSSTDGRCGAGKSCRTVRSTSLTR